MDFIRTAGAFVLFVPYFLPQRANNVSSVCAPPDSKPLFWCFLPQINPLKCSTVVQLYRTPTYSCYPRDSWAALVKKLFVGELIYPWRHKSTKVDWERARNAMEEEERQGSGGKGRDWINKEMETDRKKTDDLREMLLYLMGRASQRTSPEAADSSRLQLSAQPEGGWWIFELTRIPETGQPANSHVLLVLV